MLPWRGKAAELANEAFVAQHLARREFRSAWPGISLKAAFQFLRKKWTARARSRKAASDFRCPSHSRGVRESIRAPAKTKVWGSANQYGVQINLRRMEQFVLVDLCCHS
jgi:hypothetical protein